MKTIAVVMALALSVCITGCMSAGISQMQPAQIRATEGLILCSKLQTAYGSGVEIYVNADSVRKGSTSKSKVTMAADCTTTVESDVSIPAMLPPIGIPR